MRKEMDRNLVKGFLKASGTDIVNGNGDTVLLNGWGLGNWLLCEGYMWLSYGSDRFDRPGRIERTVRELTGSAFSEFFWKEFRKRYITKDDVKLMAELGYNSVRVPFNWRILLKDEPGLNWIEEGFTLLDNFIGWCEEYGLYAILDMHGAPGGQTGANIDDCIDDLPRLFIDQDSWEKGIAIWEEIAKRYKENWIVGGYDLLNEPIRPANKHLAEMEKKINEHLPKNHKRVINAAIDCDYLIPKLVQFYDEAIAAIRKHDEKHLITLEGNHWSTTTGIFTKRFDDNMVIHFHRYGCMPDLNVYKEFLEVSKKLNQPLWLGETGENNLEWFTAMYPLAADLGIGYNIWPWKKMETNNSPLSVNKPDNWEKIQGYVNGKERPSYSEAQTILTQYLENMLVKNCKHNTNVTRACLRQSGCTVRGTDFDLFPGKGISYACTPYNSTGTEEAAVSYRADTGMRIKNGSVKERRGGFDCGWDSFTLELKQDEFALYSVYDTSDGDTVSLELRVLEDTVIEISGENNSLGTLEIKATDGITTSKSIPLPKAEKVPVKVTVHKGVVQLDRIIFQCK